MSAIFEKHEISILKLINEFLMSVYHCLCIFGVSSDVVMLYVICIDIFIKNVHNPTSMFSIIVYMQTVQTIITPYNRIDHSDRIHHISDTLLQIRQDGRVKNPLLFCDLIN